MVKLPSLLELLAASRLANLSEIAATRDVPVAENAPKGDLVYALAARLAEPASLQSALASLTIHERIAWNALVEAGGRLDGFGFPVHFGRVRRDEPNVASRRRTPIVHPPGVVYPGERLERLGLIFSASLPYYATYIPAEIMRLVGVPLPVPADPPRPVAAPAAYSPACDIIGAAVVYLSYCRNRRVALTMDDELHSRHLSDLADMLWPQFQMAGGMFAEYDLDFLHELRRLLDRLRLIESGDRDLMVLPKAEDWLASTRHQLITDIWATFVRDEEGSDYRLVERADGTVGPVVTSLRTAMLDCLACCPTGQWISTADLLSYTYLRHPSYVRAWKGPGSNCRETEVEDELPVAVEWPVSEARSILYWLCNGLRWLGLVDTENKGEALRLTSLGAYLLGKTTTWEDEPEPRPIVVQPNFEVIVPAEAAPLMMYRLEQMADHVSRDRASIYSITPASIRRAMECGLSAEQALDFLTEAGGRELPQNVSFSIRGWAERFGEIEIRRMTVLQVTRKDLIAELGSSAKLKLKLGERLGPCAVAVDNDDLPALLTRLRKAGYSPRVGPTVDKPGASAGQSVTLPESELVVLVAAAKALTEKGESGAVSPRVLSSVQRHLSRSSNLQVEKVARSIRTVLIAQGKQGRPKAEQPAARFPRTHTEPALRKAIKDRQPVTMEYFDGNASEFSVEVIYPQRIEATQGTDLLYGESVLTGHTMAYFMDHIRTVTPGAYARIAPQGEE